MKVKFYESVDDNLLKFAVIISKYQGKWVFCKHKERNTYEVPGGHREKNESILETAKIEKIELFDVPPTNMTYPAIQPLLFQEYLRWSNA